MRGIRSIPLLALCIILVPPIPGIAQDPGIWQAPFDTTARAEASSESELTLSDAIRLTGAANPTLKSLAYERRASEAQMKQAGLWPNPELEFEIEEFGWDVPGLQESELSLSIAQEVELFGQRGARKGLARAQINATHFETRVTAFDLYLEVKRRFYELAHAQQHFRLSQTAVQLADEVAENIKFRMEKGAALQSELLLARLERQRSQLVLDQAQQEVIVASTALIALWGGTSDEIAVTALTEPEFTDVLSQIAELAHNIDSTRSVAQLHGQSDITSAERDLSAAEARPRITLSGGVKRLEGLNSNSFLFGVCLPLPLFDRNQSEREKLTAKHRSLNYQIDRQRVMAKAELRAKSIRLRQLLARHDSLDSLLIPTAEQAYETLQQSYESGRLPYMQLLEARRLLYDLNLEHNHLLLAIQEQIIELESLSGVTLRVE